MSSPAQHLQDIFTFKDYLQWDREERWELRNGVARAMPPSPGPRHQEVVLEIAARFRDQLAGKPCRPYVAPLDVRLPEGDEPDDEIRTVVQPDVMVICDPSRMDRRGYRGAPDLVVEVVSPASAASDLREKVELYERHGVKEYWVCHPEDRILFRFVRGPDGQYGRTRIFSDSENVPCDAVPGLYLDLSGVFGPTA